MTPSLIYKGIFSTPNLWFHSNLDGIEQIEIDNYSFDFEPISNKLRLGMFVEQCVFQSLKHEPNYQILGENIQIIEDNITLGEIDCILQQETKVIHLEIAYKFYLFDPNYSENELFCWIGPNRKDSLMEKIDKLKRKQFPLLYHSKTVETLEHLNVSTNSIQQKVCFKAQLFTPYASTKKDYQTINEECIQGVYYTTSELVELNNCTFFIPEKLDWTVIPYQHVKWMNFSTFIEQVSILLENQKSPMFWSKDKKGNISKSFAIWW